MSKTYCSVFGCYSLLRKNRDISFHSFPERGKDSVFMENKFGVQETMDRQKAWIQKLKIGKPVSKHMKVCSLHFTEDDYLPAQHYSIKRKCLKKIAVPSQNLPLQKPKHTPRTSRQSHFENRTCRKSEEANIPHFSNIIHEDQTFDQEAEMDAVEALLNLKDTPSTSSNSKKVRDIAVQINTMKIYTISDLIDSDATLYTLTGLHSFKLLSVIETLVKSIYKDQRTHKLNIRERILLIFIKLKSNLSYAYVSKFFGLSAILCKKYFINFLPVISSALQNAIYFPPKSETLKNMPIVFNSFNDVRVILDCTELNTQKPKCLCCRIKFYSQYKGNCTIKFMTGVSPAGLTIFISEPYGGRCSDKFIFENSNIQNYLQEYDGIMVDKGFLIDEFCQKNNFTLYRPPFLKNKSQLTAEEANLNTKIAAARVHVERSYQRIKQFQILSGKLPWHLVPHIKHIFTIACAITNLSSPILSDDKFTL